jgi:hypothetical protein
LIIEQFTHGIGTEWCLPEQILFEFSANQFHLGSSKHRMKQNLDLHFIKIRGSNFAFRSVFVAFSFFLMQCNGQSSKPCELAGHFALWPADPAKSQNIDGERT